MKPFSDYHVKSDLPTMDEYTVIKTVEYKGIVKEVEFFDEEGYKAARQQYSNEYYGYLNMFKHDMFKELDIVDNPKADLLFQHAWESGHNLGFSEVFKVAYKLVELIK